MIDFSVGQSKLSLNEVIKKQSIPSSTDLMADKLHCQEASHLQLLGRKFTLPKKSRLRRISQCIHLNYIQE